MDYVNDDTKYFYEDEDKRQLLAKECKEWLGTPWRHRTRVKQRGVDCIQFAIAVMIVTGADHGREIRHPEYSRDWHLHNPQPLLIHGLESQLKMHRLFKAKQEAKTFNPDDFMDGDIVIFRYGKTTKHAAHVGIVVGSRIYQSLIDGGVTTRDIHDPKFRVMMEYGYRILA